MSSLSLSQAPIEPVPREPKSPLRAFVLSLVLPGTGHLYCGKRNTGLSTLGFFAACLLGLVLGAVTGYRSADSIALMDLFFRPVIALYVFSFVDAFETACEANRGADLPPAGNPRIAAVLNFLTRGFGYFYIGERKKGLIVFFLLFWFTNGLRQADRRILGVAEEIILIAIAADAYRQCRRMYPAEPTGPETVSQPDRVRRLVYGLAGTVAAGYFALVVFGLFTSN